MLPFYSTAALAVAFLITTTGLSQPTHHGCHHTHNKAAVKRSLTDREVQMMNESIARSDTFDILGYIIHIDVTDYTGQYIRAATTLSVHPLMAGQQNLRLDLYNLQVDSVKNESGSMDFDYDGNILTVHYPAVIPQTDTSTITVWYQGNPYQDPTWGGFYFESGYIYNLGIGLTTIPPNFGRVWYPCFDSFVERATYEYHVKSAGTYRAHCQGTFLGEVQLAGDTVIRSYLFDQPIPTHLSAIAVADYTDHDYVHTGANGDVPVRLTAKPAQIGAMQGALINVGNAIDACEHWFGPYGWERVGYVLTTDGALEIPTNIAYPQYMTGEAVSSNNDLLCHELGHHWWGDMVTPHNHNDMWMKEGPAEYASHLLVEWMSGQDAFVNRVKTNQLYVMQNAHLNDGGYQPMSPMPDEYIYGTHTYYKGAAVMHNMRGYLGDELFRQAMSAIQENYAYQDLTPEEFRDALTAESGYDMSDFFDDQIFSPGWSTFVVDSFLVSPSGDGYDVHLYVQQKLRECPQYYENVPLDVSMLNNNWDRQEFQFTATGQFSDVVLHCDFMPDMLVLNGHNRQNQCRMDLEFTVYPDVVFNPALPFVEFRLNKENVVDSTLMRIEHIWSAPDQDNLGEGIYEISGVHYWIVDGLWDDEDAYKGRLNYDGSEADEFDHVLYNDGEQEAVLLYRPNSSYNWEVYPDFTLGPGSLTDGDGFFTIDVLRRGQYAFGNGNASVSTGTNDKPINEFILYPVPANERLEIRGYYEGRETALFDIYGMDGRLCLRSSGVADHSFNKSIEVGSLPMGNYILKAHTSTGEFLGTKAFEIIR